MEIGASAPALNQARAILRPIVVYLLEGPTGDVMKIQVRLAVAALMITAGAIQNRAAAQQPVVVIPALSGHIVSPGGLPIDGAEEIGRAHV